MAGWTVNDLEPPLQGTIRNGVGGPVVDLSAATLVTANIKPPKGIVISHAVVKSNQVTNKGEWSLVLVIGDLAEPGKYQIELEVTWPGNRPQTFGRTTFPVNPEIA